MDKELSKKKVSELTLEDLEIISKELRIKFK